MKKILAGLIALMLLLSCAWAEETEEDMFLAEGEEPIITDMSYVSSDIRIEITAQRVNKSDVYVADIYLKDVTSLQRAFGGNRWRSKMQKITTMAQEHQAIIALTGDNGHNFDKGLVFGNGKLLRKTGNNKRDLCVIYLDGTMKTYTAKVDTAQILSEADTIWQSFLFGPALLDEEGNAKTKFNTSVGAANPRAVIGYYEPGHYCLVQVDGRGTKSKLEKNKKSTGMKMAELSEFMASLGCKAAYNLDGGQSALMVFNGTVISNPYKGGRTVGDIIFVAEKE